MSQMQLYYNRLSAGFIGGAAASLSRASRVQVLEATRNFVWLLWGTN